jgi:hypothetical protein
MMIRSSRQFDEALFTNAELGQHKSVTLILQPTFPEESGDLHNPAVDGENKYVNGDTGKPFAIFSLQPAEQSRLSAIPISNSAGREKKAGKDRDIQIHDPKQLRAGGMKIAGFYFWNGNINCCNCGDDHRDAEANHRQYHL